MEFNERLNFLFEITRTNNKDLASFCDTSPSTISFLRTGARKMPRQTEKLEKMAEFFSKNIITASQRTILAEEIGLISLRRELPLNTLNSVIYQWLIGQNVDSISMLMEKFTQSYPSNNDNDQELVSEVPGTLRQTAYFPGQTGMYEALKIFFNQVLTAKEPGNIYFFSSESPLWFIDSTKTYELVTRSVLEAANRGFQIHHVLQAGFEDEAFYDTLSAGIPIYMTGNLHIYHFERFRGTVHRRTLWLYEGCCAVASNSILDQEYSPFATFTSDPFLISTHLTEVNTFLSRCVPAIIPLATPAIANAYVKDIIQSNESIIEKPVGLPLATMPVEDIKNDVMTSDSPMKDQLIDYLDSMAIYKNEYSKYKNNRTVLCPVPTIDQIMDDLPALYGGTYNNNDLTYSIKTYITHLRNTIKYMEENENYNLIPIPFDPHNNISVLIQKNKKAIVFKSRNASFAHEILVPRLLLAIQEFVLRLGEYRGYTPSKKDSIAELKELVSRLEKRL